MASNPFFYLVGSGVIETPTSVGEPVPLSFQTWQPKIKDFFLRVNGMIFYPWGNQKGIELPEQYDIPSRRL